MKRIASTNTQPEHKVIIIAQEEDKRNRDSYSVNRVVRTTHKPSGASCIEARCVQKGNASSTPMPAGSTNILEAPRNNPPIILDCTNSAILKRREVARMEPVEIPVHSSTHTTVKHNAIPQVPKLLKLTKNFKKELSDCFREEQYVPLMDTFALSFFDDTENYEKMELARNAISVNPYCKMLVIQEKDGYQDLCGPSPSFHDVIKNKQNSIPIRGNSTFSPTDSQLVKIGKGEAILSGVRMGETLPNIAKYAKKQGKKVQIISLLNSKQDTLGHDDFIKNKLEFKDTYLGMLAKTDALKQYYPTIAVNSNSTSDCSTWKKWYKNEQKVTEALKEVYKTDIGYKNHTGWSYMTGITEKELALAKEIANAMENSKILPVIHCVAGLGRTGTLFQLAKFIQIFDSWAQKQEKNSHGKIIITSEEQELFSCLLISNLLQERIQHSINAVQTLEQFKSLLSACEEYVEDNCLVQAHYGYGLQRDSDPLRVSDTMKPIVQIIQKNTKSNTVAHQAMKEFSLSS